LRLPRSSVELKIVQRHSQAIPGSRGTMEIQIGDITGVRSAQCARSREMLAVLEGHIRELR